MGFRLNRLGEPVFIAVSKPLLTEFGIHHKLESCVSASVKKVKKNKLFVIQSNVLFFQIRNLSVKYLQGTSTDEEVNFRNGLLLRSLLYVLL